MRFWFPTVLTKVSDMSGANANPIGCSRQENLTAGFRRARRYCPPSMDGWQYKPFIACTTEMLPDLYDRFMTSQSGQG